MRSISPNAIVFSRRRPRSRLRKPLIILISLLVVAILGSLGLSFYVGWQTIHPARKAVLNTPADFSLKYENVTFPSRVDHLQLQGWFIPAAKPTDRVIVMAHGFRENRDADHPAMPTAITLHRAGYSVLMFDFRDSGSSPGSMSSVGLYEQRDLLGAIDFAKSKGYAHLGVIGFSMGASTALMAAAEDDQVEAVIADSPFANLHDYLVSKMSVWTHLPNFPFTPEILVEMKYLLGLDASKVNPIGDLAHWTPRPLMLIAGDADTTIPMQNSINMYKEVKSNPDDSLWIVKGAKHVGAYDVEPQAYLNKVVSFLSTYMH